MSENNAYTDPLDMAAEMQDAANRRGIERAAALAAPERHPDFDGESCVECGEDIPQARLAMGRIRCVGCQTKREKREKGL